MWFSVSLLFKGSHLTRPHIEPLWEESIRLIDAETEEEAVRKAERIGISEEHEYEVNDGVEDEPPGLLGWTFEQVESVYPVEGDRLSDGTEVFSRFLRESEVESLLKPFDDE